MQPSWVAEQWRDRLPADDRTVGLMGISFGGGLAVVAASRMADRAGWVLSFGGHGDLPRTLRVSVHRTAAGRHRAPAARLRRRDHSARRRGSCGPGRAGRAAPRGDPLLPARLASRHGRQGERGRRVRAREATGRGAARTGADVHVLGERARTSPSSVRPCCRTSAPSAAMRRCRRSATRRRARRSISFTAPTTT